MAEKNTKKSIPLRLSQSLYAEIAKWAEDDFRSLNGQIEYLLSECVKKRKKTLKKDDNNSEKIDELQKQLAVTQKAFLKAVGPDVYAESMLRESDSDAFGDSGASGFLGDYGDSEEKK